MIAPDPPPARRRRVRVLLAALALAGCAALVAPVLLGLTTGRTVSSTRLLIILGGGAVTIVPVMLLAETWSGPDGRRGVLRMAGRVTALAVLVASVMLMLIAAGPAREAGAAVPPLPTQAPANPDGASPSAAPPADAASAPAGITCPPSVQGLVDAAPDGAVVVVPACLYRETVVLDRPITLVAEPGAEIRGSDVWTDWTRAGDGWDSAEVAPGRTEYGFCEDDGDRCHVGQQAYVDGVTLRYVEGDRPGPGEFAVLPSGRLRLGEDPLGHLVEVGARDLWVQVAASDVTLDGFRMRHSTAPSQTGGITVKGNDGMSVDRFVIRNSHLSDAHGALLSIRGGSGHEVLDGVFERGGQLGLHLSGEEGSRDWRVEGNVIRDNSTAGFATGWEAGGLKSLGVDGLTIVDNEFAGGPNGDNGRGAWTDTGTRNVVFRGNRMHGNGHEGAMFEASHGLVIEDNVAWDNGWANTPWGWGGGIVLSSSDNALVRGNLLAWNADGLSVISQDRQDDEPHVNIRVEANTVIAGPAGSDEAPMVLAWLQDWDGALCDAASGNEGDGNLVWMPPPAAPVDRFSYCDPIHDVERFAATRGGHGTRQLTDDEARAALVSAAVPLGPLAVPPGTGAEADGPALPLVAGWRGYGLQVAAAASALVLALGVLGVLLGISGLGSAADRRQRAAAVAGAAAAVCASAAAFVLAESALATALGVLGCGWAAAVLLPWRATTFRDRRRAQ